MSNTLPTDPKARKAIPIYSGFMCYFPDAIAAVAELSRIGNDQHNPGKPLHWDRSKSGDEMDALCRHMLDMASGTEKDTDDVLHATKQAWRAMAHLQKTLEQASLPVGGYDEAQKPDSSSWYKMGLGPCEAPGHALDKLAKFSGQIRADREYLDRLAND